MYILAYDEGTGFESFTNDGTQPIMIGGFVYDDMDEPKINGVIAEKLRVEAFLKNCCEQAGTVFPTDLHAITKGTDEERAEQKKREGKTRNCIAQALPEFIEKGTFDSNKLVLDGQELPERSGRYQLVTIFKKDEDKVAQDEDFMGDHQASNLYISMVREMILKCSAFNPMVKGEKPTFEFWIPTRVFAAVENDDSYDRLGYGHVYSKKRWAVIREENARQMINEAARVRPMDANSRIQTKSIDYEDYDVDRAFLYLADSLCGFLKKNDSRINVDGKMQYKPLAPKSWEQKVIARMDKLNPDSSNMFFHYDVPDDLYDRMYLMTMNDDLFEFCSLAYDARNHSDPDIGGHYRRILIPMLQEKTEKCINTDSMMKAIRKLEEYGNQDKRNPEKQISIYKFLEDAEQKTELSGEYRFRLYSQGIGAYNHIGDPVNAREF